MPTGVIKRLVRDRGFGFISVPSAKDIFFHRSAVERGSFDTLQEGQKVRFDVQDDPKGPRAVHVHPLD